MVIASPAEIRSGGPLLFLFEGSIFRAHASERPDAVNPAEVLTLNTPSLIFNLIAESNGSSIRAMFIPAPLSPSSIAELQESIRPGDFIAFEQAGGNEDYEARKQHFQSIATAIKSAKGALPLFLTNYTASSTAEKYPFDQPDSNCSEPANNAIRDAAKASGALLCDAERSFTITNRMLDPWGTSLMQSDGVTPNVFGNISLAVLLYRAIALDSNPDTPTLKNFLEKLLSHIRKAETQNINPDITILGKMLERTWFHLRGTNNLPWHFRSDKLIPILSQIGDEISPASNAHRTMSGNQKPSTAIALACSQPDALQQIHCAVMSRNGVHLLMGILSNLGGFCHFGKLDLHYEKRGGRLCLNDVGRKFVTTFATDMSLYDGRIEAEIPLRVEFSHRLTDPLFKEKWVRCVRDPRDMLVSIHDLAPIKKLDAKTAPIEETLEVPLPNAGGCIFGLGPIEEWALQESFIHHVIEKDQLCHVRFERIKSDGVAEISRLMQFIGYNVKQKQIEEALSANKVEAVRPFGKISKSGGKAGHWRSREFAALLDRRYSLVAQVLPNPHDYSFGTSAPKPVSWPDDVFAAARYGWVVMSLHKLKKQFPSARYELFRETLMNFTQLVDELPLLEIQLAEALLANGKHVKQAKEILEKWAYSPLWSPRFVALLSLAKHDAEFKRRLENSFVEAQSIWRRTKHPLIRQAASRMGFTDEAVLSACDKPLASPH